MQELEVTWKRAFLIWWAMIWRSLIISIPAILVISFFVAFITTGLGIPSETGKSIATMIIGITGIPIGILIVKMTISKKYSKFRIVLEKTE